MAVWKGPDTQDTLQRYRDGRNDLCSRSGWELAVFFPEEHAKDVIEEMHQRMGRVHETWRELASATCTINSQALLIDHSR